MAQRVNVVLVDDIDGTEAQETVTFGLGGSTYEIDLNKVHADELRMRIEEYVPFARKVSGGSKKRKAPAAGSVKAIREWARENGFNLGNTGRIPAEVQKAYEEANAA